MSSNSDNEGRQRDVCEYCSDQPIFLNVTPDLFVPVQRGNWRVVRRQRWVVRSTRRNVCYYQDPSREWRALYYARLIGVNAPNSMYITTHQVLHWFVRHPVSGQEITVPRLFCVLPREHQG